jgi:uncharacterized protein
MSGGRRLGLALCAAAAASGAAAQPAKPSFDCTRATSPVERAICGDEILAALDRSIDALYRWGQAKAAGAARRGFDDDQRRWLASRAQRCPGEKPAVDCLLKLHRDRAVALAGKARELGALAGPPVTGHYAFREAGFRGAMFVAEIPPAAAYVEIETATTRRSSPHLCELAETFARRGDALVLRHSERKPDCAIRVTFTPRGARIGTLPDGCHEGHFEQCGAAATIEGEYRRR